MGPERQTGRSRSGRDVERPMNSPEEGLESQPKIFDLDNMSVGQVVLLVEALDGVRFFDGCDLSLMPG